MTQLVSALVLRGDIIKRQEPLPALWDRRFEELKQFKAVHGHLHVSLNSPATRGLAQWVSTQRRFKAKGRRLTPARIQRLESIGFEWKPLDAYWEKMFAQLKIALQAATNDVPCYRKLPRKLHSWAAAQRKHKLEGTLTSDRIQKLDAVGFSWDPTAEYFDYRLKQLMAFKRRFGHCNVPVNYPRNQGLAHWLQNQRKKLKATTKHSEQQKRLTKIGVKPTGIRGRSRKFPSKRAKKVQLPSARRTGYFQSMSTRSRFCRWFASCMTLIFGVSEHENLPRA